MPSSPARFACALLPLLALGCTSGNGTTPAAAPVIEGHVTADDGTRLFYRKVGNGPQTVVIPAGLFLDPALRGLDAGRTLVFYDMRNRGRSDSVSADREVSIQRDVMDLENLRAELGIERFALVGWSYLGLMTALYTADHPDRVERLVQIGPVPMRFGTEYPEDVRSPDYVAAMDSTALAEVRRLRAEGLAETDPEAYCEREWAVTRFTLVGDPANVDRAPAAPCAMPNEWPTKLARHFGRQFPSIQNLEVSKDRFAALELPVLVVHGTLDRNAPYGSGREWAMTFPNARLLTIEGGAHCPWADAPAVVDHIGTFLDGSWPEHADKVTSLSRTGERG